MSLLVVGAAPGSLGEVITIYARAAMMLAEPVATAGIQREQYSLNVENERQVEEVLQELRPDSIICTVGVNSPSDRLSMEVNYHGVMNLLDEWLRYANGGQFVAISSNSAHIARTNSRGYCASKAALSMGIRCAARDNATRDGLIYAWEFGLLDGTPMTQAVASRLGSQTGLTRMPGHPRGQRVAGAARLVVDAYIGGDTALNGCTLRLDGGDQ